MTRQTELSQKTCDHCAQALGASRLIVHDPKGVSGVFHTSKCYPNAVKAKEAVGLDHRRLMDDAELIVGVE